MNKNEAEAVESLREFLALRGNRSATVKVDGNGCFEIALYRGSELLGIGVFEGLTAAICDALERANSKLRGRF